MYSRYARDISTISFCDRDTREQEQCIEIINYYTIKKKNNTIV